MGRSPCCEKVGLKKGPWTPEEDQKLLAYIEEYGHGSWRALPGKAGLQRCGKSCRLRWTNYLRPDIKRGKFSMQEEQTIIQLHALLGNRWSAIATHLPKRTDNEIKNYWNTHLKKRLTRMGIDPVTHKPKSDALGAAVTVTADGHSKNAANLSHMAQWESARLEAEARLRAASQHHHHLGPASSTMLPPPLSELGDRSNRAPCLDVIRAWHGVFSKPNADSPTVASGFSCFDKPMARMPGAFPMEPGMLNGEVALGMGADFGAGFTEMLMDDSTEYNLSEGCGESDNVEGGSCVEEGEGEGEEGKNYWSSILNLVNSSPPPLPPPSNSPPVF